jgi:hypothetical protein
VISNYEKCQFEQPHVQDEVRSLDQENSCQEKKAFVCQGVDEIVGVDHKYTK